MRESYREGVASHFGLEPCRHFREGMLEALDRGICRLGIELRNRPVMGAIMSCDEKRGIVYLPAPSPSPDRYGGERKGQNLETAWSPWTQPRG